MILGVRAIGSSHEKLAIDGGTPVFPEGPPAWPPDDGEILERLERAVADGSWGRYDGPHGKQLAERLAEMHNVPFVMLCCSGTVAVELALRGLRVGAGDEVLLAGYDFGGNFRAIEAVGARPVLVDVTSDNWNLDPGQLEAAWSPAVRAVIVSHLHGGMVPMRQVMAFAERRGVGVVEDACQAPGAVVEGRPAGTWGDVGVWSFGGSKLLTAGRGGAIVTRHADVHQRIKLACERGNHAFPLSELQAAVLLPQLDRLAERNRRRAEAAARLVRRIAPLPGLAALVNRVASSEPGYYKLGIKYAEGSLPDGSRARVVEALQAEGVAIDAGFRGFVRRSRRRCRHVGPLAQSRAACQGMMVLHHPILLEPDETIDRLAEAFEKVMFALAGSNA